MPKERGDSGQYVPTVEGDDVLDVLAAVEGPVVTSADVADGLDVSRETARRKLNALVDEGVLARRKTAGRVVYWLADRSSRTSASAAREAGREGGEAAGDGSTGGDDGGDSDAGHAATIDDVLAGWEPGRNEAERERRRAAGEAVLEWLRADGGHRSGQEFKDRLLPEHGVEGQSADTWWKKTARPALRAAVDAGLVEYRAGHHDYRWVGDGD